MSITQRHIDQAYSDLNSTHGGVKEDYFALLYLEKEFNLPREQAANQIAYCGNDYGLDAFHVDVLRRNLYLFQFKWSESHSQFKGSFQRLIEDGMERIFGNSTQDQYQNQMLLQLRTKLLENQALIDRVFIHFIFKGDPEEAERSQVLDKLREDLEAKKHLIDAFLGREISMAFQIRSIGRVGSPIHQRTTHVYPLEVSNPLESSGPGGEKMVVGFVPLMDLYGMYRDMNQRFFERNIRASLSMDAAPNRAITKALKRIVLDGAEDPSVFAFNHNGVTIYAQKLERVDSRVRVTEPRLLNGAQTISTLHQFVKANDGSPRIKEQEGVLRKLRVLAKIITEAKDDFVVSVTINNNRQNPVMPWNLHANDMIQLELQDQFRQELGIYYERQENAFSNLTQENLDDLEINEQRAVELLRLTHTFLVSDGEIDKLSRIREVFENDKLYDQVFHASRLKADFRQIILCYKIQMRLQRLVREIIDKGVNKYAYMRRGRNLLWALLCQAILNDSRLNDYAERFGRSLVIEADYTDWLARLSSTRARFLIGEVVQKEPYATMVADDRYDFIRTRAVYDKCMDLAHRKWGWIPKRLK